MDMPMANDFAQKLRSLMSRHAIETKLSAVRTVVTRALSDAAHTTQPIASVLLLTFGALGGCSMSQVAADTTAGFLADAAPAGRAYFDYESAGIAAASGLMQLEGLHRVSPDNERLSLTLAQAYVVYAFGWVMDEAEIAQIALDYDKADRHQLRAYHMYRRAADLVLRVMRDRDPGIDKVLYGDPDKLTSYLRKHYAHREDVELVFWLALSWGSAVTNAPSADALIDFGAVKAVARHAAHLDEGYENAGPLALIGGFEASYPEQYGGDWKKGREYFERSIVLSKRRNHLHLINFARTYAINAQDKELFLSLLHEVVEAPDQGEDVRLSNKVARRRAERYLRHKDTWFE
jgi:hypothetical protein